MAFVALPLLATTLTRDPVGIAALGAVGYLPWLLLALPVGALVDRMDRRRVMVIANAARATTFGVLAGLVLQGLVSLWLLYALTLVVAVAEVFYDSSARAMLPSVVARRELDRGNSWLTIGETLGGNFAGAPLGSLLFAAGASYPFIGVTAAYVVGAVLIVGVGGTFRAERPETAGVTTLRTEVGAGLRWLWEHRFLRGMTLAAGWAGLFHSMAMAVLVLLALETLGVSEAEYGLLGVVIAVAGLAGGAASPVLGRVLGRGSAMTAGTLVSAVSLVGVGLAAGAGQLVLAVAFFAFGSAGVLVWNVLSMSIRQAMIPGHLFGRVLGAYRMVIWGVMPVGALAGGLLARATDLPTVFVVAGLAQLPAVVYVALLVREHRELMGAAYADAPAPE